MPLPQSRRQAVAQRGLCRARSIYHSQPSDGPFNSSDAYGYILLMH